MTQEKQVPPDAGGQAEAKPRERPARVETAGAGPGSQCLPTELRSQLGSGGARQLRRVGRLPAVLYGHGIEPVHLSVARLQLEHLLASGARVVDLLINGNEARALIKDLQYDALGSELLHVDFQRLVAGEKVEVAVVVELVGEAVGVRRDGGVLDHLLKEITVSCLPRDIPQLIRVDVRELEIGDAVTVEEIELPGEVELVTPSDLSVLAVLPPEEVPEEPAFEEAKEPELIGRGPTEEEQGEAEEATSRQEE